jgi:hypothetical protein
MKLPVQAPLITDRSGADIAAALAANRAGYTPEWRSARGSGDAGQAVNDILARYLEIQGEGLNAMPHSLQLGFLDALGGNVLAPQPARTPLVFQLVDTASDDAGVPQGTRVAAVLPPPPPSLAGSSAPAARQAPEFYTEQPFTAMRGRLAALYSIDPQSDLYAEHGAGAPFAVFEDMQPVPHRLYLGHGELLKLTGVAQIVLSFDFATSAGIGQQRPLLLDWEYLSVDGWQPLIMAEDGTRRFTVDGKITLVKSHGPDSKQEIVAGHDSYWIRATVSSRTPQARISTEPPGYEIRYQPAEPPLLLAPGDVLKLFAGSATGTVLGAYDGRVILAAPLVDTAPGAILMRGAEVVGKVMTAVPSFRVGVDDARDLLPGDSVTLDGNSTAVVVRTGSTSLYLSQPLENVQAGLTVQLRDALPPLRPDGADAAGVLPQVDLIRVRVGFGRKGLVLDSAYADSATVDISKAFYPYTEQPRRFASFYMACKEAFTREGARIELAFTMNQTGRADGQPKMAAEYFDGARWQPLGGDDEYVDATASFTHPLSPELAFPVGRISFKVPAAWRENEVNGEKGRWLRLSLLSGDYGKPLSVEVQNDPDDASKFIVTSTPATLQPPVVTRLEVGYYVLSDPESADFCVAENDFAFAEHSEDARWPRSPFAPFLPVADRTPALHFGFSKRPPAALVSLLLQVTTPPPEGDPQPYAWDYWSARGWTELSVRDETLGLRQTGMIQFVGAGDAVPRPGLGGDLYRIRARLKSGLQSQDQIVRCAGAWLNGAWARQGQRIERDGLGTSNGAPDQSFALPVARAQRSGGADNLDAAHSHAADNLAGYERALDTALGGVPILGDELVEVREWAGRGDDWQTTLAGVDPADLRFEVDPRDPAVKLAAWVRWHPQPHFYDSPPQSRHYVVERARGIFRFPGAAGMIPPAGAPIVASYVTGGGVDGNVPAGAVRELRSGVGFVQSVLNPLEAAGGAAAELLRHARDRSVQQIRHRDRAVSFEDYEWLARAASAEVARARALPLEGPDGRGARGFVGLLLIPHSGATEPVASAELERTVLASLRQRMPAGVAGGLRIVAPQYVPVGVRAEILALRAGQAGQVEAAVRARLAEFLHPLRGGQDGRGWDFGQRVHLADLATLIEQIDGVDAVRFLQLMSGQSVLGDSVPVGPQQLVAAGDTQLKIIVPSVPYALA